MTRPVSTSRSTRARRGGDRGALSIELIGIVPIIVLVTILVVQGFYAVTSYSSAQSAARDGARALMTGNSVRAAVEAQVPDWIDIQSIRQGSDAVPGCAGRCVAVELRVPIGFPGVATDRLTVVQTAELPWE